MLQLTGQPRDVEAWERFLELGTPTQEREVYRYVRLKELYSHTFTLPKPPTSSVEVKQNTLVFINGAYCHPLSHVPKPCIALPLAEALKTYGSFLRPRLHKLVKEERDSFALLNGAYFSEGLFLYIPPKTKLEAPLRIIHIIDQIKEPTLLCPRIHVFAGKESEAKMVLLEKACQQNLWINSLFDCALEEGAILSVTSLFDHGEHGKEAHHFFALRATLKQRSSFKSYSVTRGAATSRHDFSLRLLGPEAEASLYGMWHLREDRQHHVNVLIDHQAPGCLSLQKFKGVLEDRSKSSFEGKIYVHPEAQKTEAYQINNNLVVGPHAAAYAKPNLEIFADDVKASHGATVGQLDEEQLFYLTTRGIPLSLATALLIEGFTHEIINLITDPEIRKEAIQTCSGQEQV